MGLLTRAEIDKARRTLETIDVPCPEVGAARCAAAGAGRGGPRSLDGRA